MYGFFRAYLGWALNYMPQKYQCLFIAILCAKILRVYKPLQDWMARANSLGQNRAKQTEVSCFNRLFACYDDSNCEYAKLPFIDG